MADAMVPELEYFKGYTIVRAVATHRAIKIEEAQQLSYAKFMESLVVLHHQARWQYEYNEASRRSTLQ